MPGVALARFSDREPVGDIINEGSQDSAPSASSDSRPESTATGSRRALRSVTFELQDGPWRERGERGAGCGREAPAPAPAALPCQNSNNSDKPRYRLRQAPNASKGLLTDSSGRELWDQRDEDTLTRLGPLSGSEAKMAYHLRLNVAAFIEHWGREHCLFFTLTDEDDLHPKQFAKRWSNFLRRHGSWIASFIRVLEPQRNGRPHYHVLVAVEWDTKPDAFDWDALRECQQERRSHGQTARFRALRARYKASATPELVALWAQLRRTLPKYGLGRAELLPLRKIKEAISAYIGKYLEAGLVIRKHSWKGCRRVEFDRRNKRSWLACTRVFAWHSQSAIAWRQRVGELAKAIGASDIGEIAPILGQRWAYRIREAVVSASPQEWQIVLVSLGNRPATSQDAPQSAAGTAAFRPPLRNIPKSNL